MFLITLDYADKGSCQIHLLTDDEQKIYRATLLDAKGTKITEDDFKDYILSTTGIDLYDSNTNWIVIDQESDIATINVSGVRNVYEWDSDSEWKLTSIILY